MPTRSAPPSPKNDSALPSPLPGKRRDAKHDGPFPGSGDAVRRSLVQELRADRKR